MKLLGVGVSGYLCYTTLEDIRSISTSWSKSVNYSVSTTRIIMSNRCVRDAVDFDR